MAPLMGEGVAEARRGRGSERARERESAGCGAKEAASHRGTGSGVSHQHSIDPALSSIKAVPPLVELLV